MHNAFQCTMHNAQCTIMLRKDERKAKGRQGQKGFLSNFFPQKKFAVVRGQRPRSRKRSIRVKTNRSLKKAAKSRKSKRHTVIVAQPLCGTIIIEPPRSETAKRISDHARANARANPLPLKQRPRTCLIERLNLHKPPK